MTKENSSKNNQKPPKSKAPTVNLNKTMQAKPDRKQEFLMKKAY